MHSTTRSRSWTAIVSIGVLAGAACCCAQESGKPKPTHANFQYGRHERNVLDFWQAKSANPTPVVVFIHGGGFRGGSKDGIKAEVLQELLSAGISVAAFNYRLVEQALLPAAHHDCRRALQVLRSKATDWNIDNSRIGAFGGSAGAQICMYLAFHDDMARLNSEDPIERQSTRLKCVATTGGQTTMDVDWWLKNIPGYDRPHRDFYGRMGVSDKAAFLAVVADVSALSLISKDDPPIYMSYAMSPSEPVPEGEKAEGWKVHHVQFGLALKQKMDALNVESHLVYPGSTDQQYEGISDFMRAKLASGGEGTSR